MDTRKETALRMSADTTSRWATPPTARWNGLPAPVFGLVADGLLTQERLAAERVCAQWYRHSAQDCGWGHSLDLLALPLPPRLTWKGVHARLRGRLQPHRVLHVRCYYHTLTLDGEARVGRGGAGRPIAARMFLPPTWSTPMPTPTSLPAVAGVASVAATARMVTATPMSAATAIGNKL